MRSHQGTMKENTDPHPAPLDLTSTLARLERLLEREHAALEVLDHEALDAATEEKLSLHEALLHAGTDVSAEQREALERIHRSALANQLLLVHARACVRGILALAIGAPAPDLVPSPGGGTAPAPVRVDFRG